MFVGPADLAAQVALVDRETAGLGLTKTVELEVGLPPEKKGGTAIVRGYEGRDVAGRVVHAVRVATPRGVVLAAGPLDADDLDRSLATELVTSIEVRDPGAAVGLVLAPGTDLNGDGAPDLVLRNAAGVLAIWRITMVGSGGYDVTMEAPPTVIVRLPEVGRPALWGARTIAPNDPIAPRLTDVATFQSGRYVDTSAEARAWHAHEAMAQPPPKAADAVRLQLAIERAWHLLLSGAPRAATLAELAKERAPESLAARFEIHKARVVALRREDDTTKTQSPEPKAR